MTPERFARLEELFAGATELQGAERARFVAEATAGDAALRTELERLLAADESSRDSLGGAISFLAATPAEDEPAPVSAADDSLAPAARNPASSLSDSDRPVPSYPLTVDPRNTR